MLNRIKNFKWFSTEKMKNTFQVSLKKYALDFFVFLVDIDQKQFRMYNK